MKVKFKLYQYIDGHGATVFRLKKKVWFWYEWVTYETCSIDDPARIFASREAAVDKATEIANKIRQIKINNIKTEKNFDLKLVIVEDIEA